MIYTAIAGDYPIARKDIVCFGGEGIFAREVMEAKRYKILPHLFFPDPITMWVDGNVFPLIGFEQACAKFLGDADIAIFRHSYRDTVWQEFAALRKDQRFNIPWLQKQLLEQEQAYRADLFPEFSPGAALYECNFMIRRNNQRVNRMMEFWWAQICRWQWRDQVSFPYVAWKHPQVDVVSYRYNIRDHPDFRYVSQY